MSQTASAESTRIYLKDYQPPAYTVETIDLAFLIHDDKTHVISTARYTRHAKTKAGAPLRLNGVEIKLISVQLDNRLLKEGDYTTHEDGLEIANAPESFELKIETEIDPANNTSLEGLYASGPMFCTQCEAEGFRHITYYPDRPDVMARFSTSIEADKKKFPVLLSNGNLVSEEDIGDGRHRVRWQDPFPKPCYLFALVAGNLAKVEDHFKTASGRDVLLQIYCEEGKADQLHHAMESLKKSMRWDEQRFGREYDLDRFMIVATPFFNMGAMENKGLNIFNDAYLLGRPEMATDRDLYNIESVVAHEYFHNWSGNRITCRDWFQLSLKEGFTVFRDQEFSTDMHSPATERIDQVRGLRMSQFQEDAGPMSHPVRPDSYVAIDNFYTATVYEKGAEVVRMLQTLFGRDGFRKGTDLYFSRFDGQAVTCDDFVAAIFEANPQRAKEISLEHFKLWYSQSGTPRIGAKLVYDADKKTCRLTLTQTIPPSARQPEKSPMLIPVQMALLGADGKDIPGTSRLAMLEKAEQEFVFENVPSKPVPSLFRDFSAPVILQTEMTEDELAFVASHDGNAFNRWDAMQKLAQKELARLIDAAQNGKPLDASSAYLKSFTSILQDAGKDAEFTALSMALPSEGELGQGMLLRGKAVDPDAIHRAREALRRQLAASNREKMQALYEARAKNDPLALDGKSMGDRALKNVCLMYLASLADESVDKLALQQFEKAGNMTDAVAALGALSSRNVPQRQQAFDAFYQKWQAHKLVVDKWFSLQVMADRPDALDQVKKLMQHPAFMITNPNMVYAVIRGFAANLVHFHEKGGSGYRFLADQVLQLDSLNPLIAGRILTPLIRYADYDTARAGLMQGELLRILEKPGLSKNVREVAEAGLHTAKAA
jgi:aminopeptidase N